jgi:hypothetical protein
MGNESDWKYPTVLAELEDRKAPRRHELSRRHPGEGFEIIDEVGLIVIPTVVTYFGQRVPSPPAKHRAGVKETLVMKIGVALGFVLLFRVVATSPARRWLTYAGIWWLMYAVVEVGQALGPGYGLGEAVAGIVAEAIYFPLSGKEPEDRCRMSTGRERQGDAPPTKAGAVHMVWRGEPGFSLFNGTTRKLCS